MRFEVRCCCNPRKLLGHLNIELPPNQTYLSFPIFNRQEILWNEWEDGMISVEEITLEKSEIELEGRAWVALKSKDYPIEKLKLIKGFEAA